MHEPQRILRTNAFQNGTPEMRFEGLCGDCRGWVGIQRMPQAIDTTIGELIHLALSLPMTIDPLPIIVAVSVKDETMAVGALLDKVGMVYDALEGYERDIGKDIAAVPLLTRATLGHGHPHDNPLRVRMFVEAVMGIEFTGLIPQAKFGSKSTVIAIPARPGTYPHAPRFRTRAFIHADVDRMSARCLIPPGLYVIEKSIAHSLLWPGFGARGASADPRLALLSARGGHPPQFLGVGVQLCR